MKKAAWIFLAGLVLTLATGIGIYFHRLLQPVELSMDDSIKQESTPVALPVDDLPKPLVPSSLISVEADSIAQALDKFKQEQTIESLNLLNQVVAKRAPLLGPMDARNLMEQTEAVINNFAGHLNEAQQTALKNYSDSFDRNTSQKTNEEQQQKALQRLNPEDRKLASPLVAEWVQAFNLGEGDYDFRLDPQYSVKYFSPRLKKDEAQYVIEHARDNAAPFNVDAGITVPWSEVARRVRFFEDYTTKYPSSYYYDSAKKEWQYYLRSLMLGDDNTRTIEDGKQDIEVKAEYDKIIAQAAQSKTAQMLTEFQQALESMTNTDGSIDDKKASDIATQILEKNFGKQDEPH